MQLTRRNRNPHNWRTWLKAALGGCLIAIATIGQAIAQTSPQTAPPPGKIPDAQLLSYLPKDALPPDTVAWQLLRQVKLVEGKKTGAKAAAMLPEFSAQVKMLDKMDVRLYGFVLPLSTSQKQKHFLLSPLPSHCPFCVDQGPDSMVEVIAKTPIEFTPWDPVVLSGKLELVNDQYLFYRLIDAEAVKR